MYVKGCARARASDDNDGTDESHWWIGLIADDFRGGRETRKERGMGLGRRGIWRIGREGGCSSVFEQQVGLQCERCGSAEDRNGGDGWRGTREDMGMHSDMSETERGEVLH